MSKIYPGQDFTITLDSEMALDAATILNIKYIKPDGTAGTKTAVASGNTASVAFVPSDTDSDDTGSWRFYIHAVIGGKTLFGETFKYDLTPIGQ